MLGLFIITRNRHLILKETIHAYLKQTFVPSLILVIDNSETNAADTASVVASFNSPNIRYYAMGYNSGPAGGAKAGLALLFQAGCEWVLWGDDDDPPIFEDAIEKVFSLTSLKDRNPRLGIVGAVGARFNFKKGRIEKLKDNELTGIIPVDYIAGGMLATVHRSIYENGLLPDEDLFFSFEDLDFTLAVKRAGFEILVDGKEMYRYRSYWSRLNLRETIYNKKKVNAVWREYYSLRNLIYILATKEKKYIPSFVVGAKALLKIPYGYLYGFSYGNLQAKMILRALFDFFNRKMNYQVKPEAKSVQ